jgi:hypothetical protein
MPPHENGSDRHQQDPVRQHRDLPAGADLPESFQQRRHTTQIIQAHMSSRLTSQQHSHLLLRAHGLQTLPQSAWGYSRDVDEALQRLDRETLVEVVTLPPAQRP